ncbi:MAG: 50S ribosomal protein L22 [Verrucomicrobiota bacterium]
MAVTPTQAHTVRAQAKWVRMSARKGRVVAEHIRGRSVPEARAVLAFTPRAAAREIEKVLASAVANAEANHGLNGDDLVVHAAVVDEGPMLKRWRARARGRVARIKKRTCHITLTLVSVEVPGAAPPKPRRAAEVSAKAPTTEAKPDETMAEEKPKRTPKPKTEAATGEKPRRTRRTTSSSKPKAPRKDS